MSRPRRREADPRYADAFHPDYPPGLRREGLEGSSVTASRITADERGRVIAVDGARDQCRLSKQTAGAQGMALQAVARDSIAVRAEQTMTVHFRLED